MWDNCLTDRENVLASTLKNQISEVVKSVAQLIKEVRSLKKQEHVRNQLKKERVHLEAKKRYKLGMEDPKKVFLKLKVDQ